MRDHAELCVAVRLAACPLMQVVPTHGRPIAWMDELQEMEAEHYRGDRVDVREASLGVGAINDVPGLADEVPIPGLAHFKRRLGVGSRSEVSLQLRGHPVEGVRCLSN